MRFFSRIPLLVWFAVPTVIALVAGVLIFTKNSGNMDQSEKEVDKRPQAVSSPVEGVEEFEIVSQTHIPEGTKSQDYNSNPPTSGQHYPAPAKNGVHEEELPDQRLVHNLEHGYVWIAYKSDISGETKDKLKEIVEEDNWKVVMVPRSTNDVPVILVAWGRYLKMQEADFEKVKEFIETYRNRGPERTPE